MLVVLSQGDGSSVAALKADLDGLDGKTDAALAYTFLRRHHVGPVH